MLNGIEAFDLNVLTALHDAMQCVFLDKTMPFITSLGNSGFIWIIISIVLLFSKRYRTTGILCLCALLVTTILGEGIIKHVVQRQRPFNHINSLQLLISEPVSFSFPSGHTGSSFAAATVLGSRVKKWAPWVYVLAATIAFSRLYLMVHYLTDVLCGAILGTISGILVLLFYNRRKNTGYLNI